MELLNAQGLLFKQQNNMSEKKHQIALYGAHGGLIRMMKDLLEDFEVIYYDNSVYHDKDPDICMEEIAISTFPYRDLRVLPASKKVIIYATDPFVEPELLEEFQKRENVIVVGDVDGINVYPPANYKIEPKFVIPHCINPAKYPIYSGEVNAIAICNRKPEERWWEITRGKFGASVGLDDFLQGIPYHILHIPNDKDFFPTLAKYKAVFYYSNNPYTLMMFELMTMGMPMVAFGHSRYGDSVMKKYIPNVSTDKDFIRNFLLRKIAEPAQIARYNIYPFEKAKAEWNQIICDLI